MPVEDVIFEAQIKFDRSKSDLESLEKELKDVTETIGTAEKGSDDYRKAQIRLKEINKQLSGSFDKQGKSVSGLSKKLGGLKVIAASVFAADLLRRFATAGFESATALEQNQIAFETMLGSGEAAKKLLGEIQSFTASTPFQEEEVTSAGKALLAFNIEADKVVPTLKRIGDISAGIGAPIGEIAEIYGKARVQGRLFAEDINQLTGRGIPVIQELAKQFGISDGEVKKLVESGKVGFPELEQAFVSLTSEGGKFAGLTEKLSGSTKGALSTLKDNIIALARDAVAPFLPAITEAFQNITKGIEDFRQAIGLSTKEQKKSVRETIALTKETQNFINTGQDLLGQYDELISVENQTSEQKEELKNITNDLIDQFGDSVISIDNETGALRVNREEIIKQIQARAAFNSENVQQLLADRAQLTIIEEKARQAEKSLQLLKSSISNEETSQFPKYATELESYISLLQRATGNEDALSLAFDGQLFTNSNEIINALPRDVQNVINKIKSLYDSSVVGGANQIKDIDEQLKSLGVSLDDLSEQKLGGKKENSNETDEQKRKRILDEDLAILAEQERFAKEKAKLEHASEIELFVIKQSFNQKRIDAIENAGLTELSIYEKISNNVRLDAIEGANLVFNDLENILSEKERISLKELKLANIKESEILEKAKEFAKEKLQLLQDGGKKETDAYRKLQNDITLLEKEIAITKKEERQKSAEEENDETQRHEEAIKDIEEASEIEKLKNTLNFEKIRLDLIKARFGEESNEYKKQENLINEINARIANAEADRFETRKQAAEALARVVISAANDILSVELDKNQQQIEGQQTRVEKAKELAEKGNADILEQEEKRLDKLQEKRAKFARAQAALAQIEIIANSLVAVTKAAAQGGAAAPFTIAATLIALGVGIVQARQKAQNAASFDVGGEYDYTTGKATYSNQTGFTGEGNFSQVSSTLGKKPYTYHKREFISNGKAVSVGRNRMWLEKLNREAFNMDHVFETARKVHSYEIQHKVNGGSDSGETKKYFIEMKEEMHQLRKEIRDKPVSNISVTEDGIKEVVHQNNIKTTRMKRIGG
jgi:tape measure domain-containing protein